MNARSILRQRPAFTAGQAEAIARASWHIEVKATTLPGERDQNFLLEAADGSRSLLRIANGLDDRPLLEAQNAAMAAAAAAGARCPAAIAAADGSDIAIVEDAAGAAWLVRRLTWLDGEPLARVRYRPDALLSDAGRAVAMLGRALDGFDHPAVHRTIDWDPLRALGVVRNGLTLIADPDVRAMVRAIAERFEQTVQPSIESLPKAVIHADANDHNIIVGPADRRTGERDIVGLIDFGDIMHSCRVGDPAITIAYAMLDAADPLRTMRLMIAAYNAVRPLNESEIAALYGMACMRLCVSACMAAKQRLERPDDDYLTISQEPVARTLPALARIPIGLAEAHARYACGLEPSPTSARVVAWLKDRARPARSVVAGPVGPDDCAVVDLSVDSPLISGDPELNEEAALTERIRSFLDHGGAQCGIARWDEARLLNTGGACRADNAELESRTVHLGQDLYMPAGSPIHAPLAGTVATFNDNDAPQDYGPVIVLRHATDDGTVFHTLYGHLSRQSLVGLFEGREIEAGERIGTIGPVAENGGWTPHLHFQLIIDPFGMGTEFPGICRAGEREIWKSLSPDPDLLLRLLPDGPVRNAAQDVAARAARENDASRAAPGIAPGSALSGRISGADRSPDASVPVAADIGEPVHEHAHREILATRAAHVGPNLSVAYRRSVHAVRGFMQYLYDDTGRRFLDAYNNVPHVGHCHPRVVEAGARQMALLNTNTRYVNRLLGGYAERLSATLPDGLDVVWFVNSASEANELALRLARAHTRRRATIVLEHAYHGNTNTLIDISPYKHGGPGGQGAPDRVRVAPMPDVYRGQFRRDDPEAGAKYAAAVGSIVDELGASGDPPAAFIAESCPSVGGQIMLPAGYLTAVYDHVRAAGAVCIADEVQTGYGRLGTRFYAFEDHDIVPDIVVLGKPIGNGHPIGAVITTREIARSFDNGMEFFSTFGGNTVSCAIGLAVLDVVEEENLMEHARVVGGGLLDALHGLADSHPLIGDVRGSGLFIGVELVRDLLTLEPAGDEAAFVCERMRDRGVLIGTDGAWDNVLKIRPPMPFGEEDAEQLLDAFDPALREADSNPGFYR